MDYTMTGGMRLDPMPGAVIMNFEFYKDGTLNLTNNKDAERSTGTWSYNKNKKLISVAIKGGSNMTISSLKEDELIIVMDMSKATPDDPTEIKLFFKIKTT